MTTHLTTQAVAATLAKLAEEFPDRDGSGSANDSETGCKYLYPNGTRCIAGQVLHDLGVDSELYDHSQDDIGGVFDNELDGRVTYNDDVLDLLQAAQGAQDEGIRWAEAVRRAFDAVGITHPKGA